MFYHLSEKKIPHIRNQVLKLFIRTLQKQLPRIWWRNR